MVSRILSYYVIVRVLYIPNSSYGDLTPAGKGTRANGEMINGESRNSQ